MVYFWIFTHFNIPRIFARYSIDVFLFILTLDVKLVLKLSTIDLLCVLLTAQSAIICTY